MRRDSEPIILELDDRCPPSQDDCPEGHAVRTVGRFWQWGRGSAGGEPAACPDAARGRHWTMLLISCGVMALAFVLEVRPDQRVALPSASQYPMPETCMSRQLFGLHCPGCGLTRSLIYLAHGDWQTSLAMHRLGWVMAVAILLQFPYRISCLRHGSSSPLGKRIPQWFGYALISALIANWLFEIVYSPLVH